MRRTVLCLLCLWRFAIAADSQFNGSWDITVHDEKHPRAWWLKVEGAGTASAKGEFVSAYAGDLNHIDEISIDGNEIIFGFRPKPRGANAASSGPGHPVYRARLVGDKLEGTSEKAGQNPPLTWTGVRAPSIPDQDGGSWREGEVIELLNTRDLSGWHALESDRESKWSTSNGVLTAPGQGANLITDRKFWNFKLHVEYKIPPGSNSGIGLRARYEVQIRDDDGKTPGTHSNGALYSRIAPRINSTKPASEWQTYDIRLVGRQVTIVLNGVTIIDKGTIEGLTAIASDPNEGEPGAIILQGDHGPVEFRNIRLTPLVKR